MDPPPSPPLPGGAAATFAPLSPQYPASSDPTPFTSSPPRGSGHRRAHSEVIGLPDDLDLDGITITIPDDPNLFSSLFDVNDFTSAPSSGSDFQHDGSTSGSSDRPPTVRRQHSLSMDGGMSLKPASSTFGVPSNRAFNLSELALTDPKKAKRIWANRQAALRSKERKMHYTNQLEQRVHDLHLETTALSTQLAMLQRDAQGLTAENNELKIHLCSMEKNIKLQDDLNDALKAEVERLKLAAGQANFSNVELLTNLVQYSFGGHHQNQAVQPSQLQLHPQHQAPTACQLQQLQVHPQHQAPTACQLQQLQVHPQHQAPHRSPFHPHQQQQLLQYQQQQAQANLKLKGVTASQNDNSAPKER